jgi:hypothetical protein
MGNDAALQILAKGLTELRLSGVVVALAVELTCTGKFIPGLEMVGDDLVFGLNPCHTYDHACALFTFIRAWYVRIIVILLHPESCYAGDGRCPCKSDAVR